MENKKRVFYIGFLIVLIAIPFVSAFGVTSSSWDENPLEMYPGEVKETGLILQNMVGDKDVKVTAEITKGQDMASILDKENVYLVPLGRKDVNVRLRIALPENAKVGMKYDVTVSFVEIAQNEGKMIQMATSVGTTIPIVVKAKSNEKVQETITAEVQKEEKLSPKIIITAILLVLVIVIAYIIFRKLFKKR